MPKKMLDIPSKYKAKIDKTRRKKYKKSTFIVGHFSTSFPGLDRPNRVENMYSYIGFEQ